MPKGPPRRSGVYYGNPYKLKSGETVEPGSLGAKIAICRKLKGWTQTELAEKLDTNYVVISRWERNKAKPSTRMRKRLAEVFNLRPSDFR